MFIDSETLSHQMANIRRLKHHFSSKISLFSILCVHHTPALLYQDGWVHLLKDLRVFRSCKRLSLLLQVL